MQISQRRGIRLCQSLDQTWMGRIRQRRGKGEMSAGTVGHGRIHGDFSSEKLGKTATELNLARDWHWEIDRETANSSLQSTAAKIEQRWLAASNGGGGVTATR